MHIETTEALFEALEAERIRKGFTERSLAIAAGFDGSHYWYFKNKTRNIQFETLLKYCQVLGLKISIN